MNITKDLPTNPIIGLLNSINNSGTAPQYRICYQVSDKFKIYDQSLLHSIK